MKIVFLIISYAPHQLVSIKALIDNYKCEVHAFCLGETSEEAKSIESLITYELQDYSREDFLKKILEIQPKLMAVAGWIVKDFVWVSKQIRKFNKIPVIAYLDTQWSNSFRQNINCLIGPWHMKKAFSHMWVAGIYQFEYARKLGFEKHQIIYNSLSCDTRLFEQCPLEKKQAEFPKNFLFIGRFVEVKGLDHLVKAWDILEDKKGWTLTLVGDGHLKGNFKGINGIIIKNFMPQRDLIKEMENAGSFILPSIFEPWALVIHEAAAAAIPLIATEVCGAVPHFLIDGFNGFRIKPSNPQELKTAMEKIMNMSDEQLLNFSINSRLLARSITPEIGAANLMSLIVNNSYH